MVRRKKIAKFLSNDDTVLPDILDNEEEGHRGEGDRPYTHEQIAKLLEFSDLRGLCVHLNAEKPWVSHGFRKFFDTTCTNSGMNPIYIEFCLGHSLKGVKDSYFLPQPDSDGGYLDILEGRDKSPG
jgi:hypothetical protein